MKNKKGFTLIELLIVIVVIASILGIAIVSVNKISNSQKEKAYDSVKDQVITAAKEYFDNNEYFINNLGLTESQMGFVSLGTLVNMDYINSVTNPINNQKLDMCSFVKVTSDKKYEYVDDQGEINKIREMYSDCVMPGPSELKLTEPSELVVVDVAAFTVKIYEKKISECSNNGDVLSSLGYNKDEAVVEQTTDWYNSNTAPNGLFIEIVDDKTDDKLEYVFYSNKSNSICIDEDKIHELIIVSTDSTLDDQQYKLFVRLDRRAPIISAIPRITTWTNVSKVDVDIKITDDISMVKSENRYWNKYALTETQANSSNYAWNSGYSGGNNKITNNINKDEYTHTENYSGEGFRKGKIQACDYAGNCGWSDEYIVKIDRTAPTVSVATKTSSWVNTSVTYTATANDNVELASLYGYWNKYGKTESAANSSDCKWQGSSYGNSNCKGGQSETNLLSAMDEDEFNSSFSAQGVRKIRFKACDIAGNCATSNEAIARIDKSNPTVILRGYVGTQKRLNTIKNSNLDDVIEDHLVERTDDTTWVGGHLDSIVLRASSSDTISGVNATVCTDPRPNSVTFASWRRVMNSNEGVFTFECTVTDRAGNSSSDTYVVKRDITPPKITGFENTKNKSCKTPNGYDCYYSHFITAADDKSNSGTVSGLASGYKYNHCYDNATSSQNNILCPSGYKSTEAKKNTSIYPAELNGKTYGYANRTFTNGKHEQHYTHTELSGYYNLFYKMYDKAGNSVCYRYKLKYTNSNKYTTALPTYVSSSKHCDDQ